MKLNLDGVKALKVATTIALEQARQLTPEEYESVRELHLRALDALENWTYDQKTETWSVKR